MKKVLAIMATLALSFWASVLASASSIPIITLNPAVNQSGNLVPGDIDQLITEWAVTAPDTEGILITSLRINLVGEIGIENLFLRDKAENIVAFPFVTPTADDTFEFISGLTVAPDATAFLILEGDIFSSAKGTTIQASIPDGGLGAVGLTSSIFYTEPSSPLAGDIREVGSSPEPSTFVFIVTAFVFIGVRTLRRRKHLFI